MERSDRLGVRGEVGEGLGFVLTVLDLTPEEAHHLVAATYHWGEEEIWQLLLPRVGEILMAIGKSQEIRRKEQVALALLPYLDSDSITELPELTDDQRLLDELITRRV